MIRTQTKKVPQEKSVKAYGALTKFFSTLVDNVHNNLSAINFTDSNPASIRNPRKDVTAKSYPLSTRCSFTKQIYFFS
jgi:hypothetical protein